MTDKDLKHDIMNAIKDGDVQMHSKQFFVGKALLSIVGITFIILAILFLGSFIIFMTSESSAWELTQFGTAGIVSFITSLPWIILGVGLLLIGMLAKLIQKYPFAYHKPIVASIAIITAVSVGGGYAVAQTSIHKKISNHVETGKLKAAAPLYKRAQRNPKQLHIGSIKQITQKGFILHKDNGASFDVWISEKTKTPPNYQPQPEHRVGVFGKIDKSIIRARGIKPVSRNREIKKPRNQVDASNIHHELREKQRKIRIQNAQ